MKHLASFGAMLAAWALIARLQGGPLGRWLSNGPYWRKLLGVYGACFGFVAPFALLPLVAAAFGDTHVPAAPWEQARTTDDAAAGLLYAAHLCGLAGVGIRVISDVLTSAARGWKLRA